MFFEFVDKLLSLDLVWLASLVFNNLHYLFAFGALMFFFFDRRVRSAIVAFVLFCFLAWAYMDLEATSGWLFFVGGFLMLNYIVKLAVLTFAQADPKLSKHLLIVNFFSFYVLWSIYNLYLVK